MNNDIKILKTAIDLYGSQTALATAMAYVYNAIGEGRRSVIDQRRISAWLYRERRVPVDCILPLVFALRRVGRLVKLADIRPDLFPESMNPGWMKKIPVPDDVLEYRTIRDRGNVRRKPKKWKRRHSDKGKAKALSAEPPDAVGHDLNDIQTRGDEKHGSNRLRSRKRNRCA